MRATFLSATLLAVAVSAFPPPASADEGEVQVSASPTFELLPRHGRTNRGMGGHVTASLGLLDFVSAEAQLGCDRFQSLSDGEFTFERESAQLFYDATRCSLVPFAVGRFGAQFVGTFGVGLGYRFETASARDVVSTSDVLLGQLDAVTDHQLIAAARAGFEWRFLETFSAAVSARATLPLLAERTGLDYSLGVSASYYSYP